MMVRHRRLEQVVIGLTVAFVCFLGGYFTGQKSAVSIVPVSGEDVISGRVVSVGGNEVAGNPAYNGGTGATNAAGAASGKAEEPGAVMASSSVGIGAGSNASGAHEVYGGGAAPVSTALPAAPDSQRDGRININLASQSELTDLPGIGEVIAGRIIDYRNKNGPFKSIEDIRKVSGIGEKKYEAIADKITVG